MTGMDWKRLNISKDIDWAKTGKAIRETLISVGQGTFLLRLRVDKLFPYILVLFLIGCLNIWWSYEVEQTVLKVEKNKEKLETMKIYHSHITGEIVELNRLSTIEQMLKETGSEVQIPQKPADRIRQ